MLNFIQGESWTQDLRLLKDGQPVVIGPADKADQLVESIEVVLTVNQHVQERYRYPYSEQFPDHEILEVDPFDDNALRLKITRRQSLRFEPGYLTAVTTIQYRDGRCIEVIQIMGNLLRADLAVRI